MSDELQDVLPFARTLGITLAAQGPDEVRCRLDGTDHLAGAGVGLHGGAILGLADTAAGICAFLNLPEGATGTTTVDASTSFLRAVRTTGVEAVARPLRAGRSVIVVETDVIDGDGRLAARGTQSQLVLRPLS